MLEALFGNKNVQNILLFLFVNGKCYGSQLQRQLKMPLTPIQKAFGRLEKGEIIISFFEGKTKLYQFNPSYPLLTELELLLKKAYGLLLPQEKRRFTYVAPLMPSALEESKSLLAIWNRLAAVSQLAFHAKTKSNEGSGWSRKGQGEVLVVPEGNTILVFHEKGTWKDSGGQDISFSNVFRWTLDVQAKVVSLEHLRMGVQHPVFLFHLALDGPTSLCSIDSHLCNEDAYFGKVYMALQTITLKWRVIGPRKNEEIETHYSRK